MAGEQQGLEALLASWAASPNDLGGAGDPLPGFSLDDLLIPTSPGSALGGGTPSSAAAAQHQAQAQLQAALAAQQANGLPSYVLPNVSSGLSLDLDAARMAAAPPPYAPGPGGLPVLPSLSLPADSGPQGGSDAGGEGQVGRKRRGPRPRIFKKHACQSDGCNVDLSALSFYLQRNHICPDHLKAESYMVKGVPSRFCQRCGQGHPLSEFDGSKRSCRKALERHNQRRRDKQAASTATALAADSGEPATVVTSQPATVVTSQPRTEQQQQQQQEQEQATNAMVGSWLGNAFPPDMGQQQQQPLAQAQAQQAALAAQQQAQVHAAQQAQAQQQAVQAQQQAQAALAAQQQAQQQAGDLMEAAGSVHGWALVQPHQPAQPSRLGLQPQPAPLSPQQQQFQLQQQQVQQQQVQQQQQQQQVQQQQVQQQQVQQQQQQQQRWVMLPQHLLEQHAPRLLAAAMAVAGPAAQSLPAPQPQPQPLPFQQQQSLPPPQQQQQQQMWQPKPDLDTFSLAEPEPYLLFGDEFGGSGI